MLNSSDFVGHSIDLNNLFHYDEDDKSGDIFENKLVEESKRRGQMWWY